MRGFGFDELPNELVMGYNRSAVLNTETSYSNVYLVEKNSSEMVFEVRTAHTFVNTEVLNLLATPFSVPRSIIEYRLFS